MASTTTNNGATVDNLNVLDALTSDNLAGAQIIELQDIAYALFPSTNATQTLTIDSAFWTGNLRLTFQVGGKYFTLWGVSQGNFDLVQSDAYGTALNSAPLVTFGASSASSFLSAFLTNVNLVATGLTSTSLLTAFDITGGVKPPSVARSSTFSPMPAPMTLSMAPVRNGMSSIISMKA